MLGHPRRTPDSRTDCSFQHQGYINEFRPVGGHWARRGGYIYKVINLARRSSTAVIRLWALRPWFGARGCCAPGLQCIAHCESRPSFRSGLFVLTVVMCIRLQPFDAIRGENGASTRHQVLTMSALVMKPSMCQGARHRPRANSPRFKGVKPVAQRRRGLTMLMGPSGQRQDPPLLSIVAACLTPTGGHG